MHTSKITAYSFLALAQAAIGVNVIAGKYVLDQAMPTFLFLGLRFLISSLFLSIILLLTKSRITSLSHPSGVLQTKDWGYLLAQAMTGGVLFNYLFYTGIQYTTATSAGIIGSTLPAMIALCAYFCLRERLTLIKWLGILLAMAGILVISLDNTPAPDAPTGSDWGDLLILIAMVPEALYCIFNKFIGSRFTPLGGALIVNWIIFWMMLPLASIAFFEVNMTSFSLITWAFVALGGICSALFFWAWAKGLLLITASTAAIFGGVMPVVTSFLGYFFLHEPFGWYELIGILLVLASLVVGTGLIRIRAN